MLDDVSLRIEAGQTVALVGATGSGKSTLISLLPRLHEPPPGTVFVDGVDVREIPLARAARRDRLRAAGAVPVLRHDRRERRVRRRRCRTRPRRRLRCACAPRPRWRGSTRTSPTFPNGYETMVGERGITLSGGQKQRTALARAVMRRPAHPDPGRCAVGGGHVHRRGDPVAAARRDARSGRRSSSSHRISTVRDADQIFVLDDGRIVERGTHDELVARGGLYAELYRKQLLEEELAAS